MRRWLTWVVIGVLAIALGRAALHLYARLERQPAHGRAHSFYIADPGATIRFPLSTAVEIHVVSRFVPEGTPAPDRYRVAIAYLDQAGGTLETRELALDVAADRERMADGTRVTPARLIRLVPPSGALVLELRSLDGRGLVRLAQPSARRSARDRVLRSAGIDPSWLAAHEAASLRSERWTPLPALGDAATVVVETTPVQTTPAAPTMPRASLDTRVGPTRAAVWNLRGPGSVKAVIEGDGCFAVVTTSRSRGARALRVCDRAAPPTIALDGEPSTVVVAPIDGSTGRVQLDSAGVRSLDGGTLVPAHRRIAAFSDPTGVRFELVDERPLRLVCRSVDPAVTASCAWRLLDVAGKNVTRGRLAPPPGADPFSALEARDEARDVGSAVTSYVVPPPGASAIEVTTTNTVVQLAVLTEEGADGRLAPPYDTDEAPLRWVGAPVRAPAWMAIPPATTTPPAERSTVSEMPRLASRDATTTVSMTSLLPVGAPPRREMKEASRRGGSTMTPLLPGESVTVVVAETGGTARRIEASCRVPGKLGGEIALRVDDQIAARATALTGALRLVASATPGPHRLTLVADKDVRCAASFSTTGSRKVSRSVFSVSGAGARWVVYKPEGDLPVHVAIYAASSSGEVEVDVDRGRLARRRGVFGRVSRGAILFPWQAPGTTGDHPGLERVLERRVTLAADLAPGAHIIQIRSVKGEAWARLWAPGRKPSRERIDVRITSDDTP